MGEQVNTNNGIVIAEIDTGRTGKRASSKGNSSTDTKENGSGGSGTGGTRGRTGTTTEEKIVPGLVDVKSEEEKKREERNAKRRERYARQKAEQGKSVKPKKVNKKSDQVSAPTFSTEQLNALIKSLSVMVASRPKCEHWLLSDAEISSITEPLTKMLAESNALKIVSEHSNQIALVMACVTVFVPRILKTVADQKEVKKVERNVKQSGNTDKLQRDKTKNNKSNGTDNSRPATNGANNGNNEPWFGQAIC